MINIKINHSVRKFLPALSIALLVTLFLVACSSGATSEAPPAYGGAPTATPATEGMETTLPVAVAVLPTPASGEPALTADQNVNVRSGPGSNYPVLFILPGGQQAQLTGISQDGTYYIINVPVAPQSQGWVDINYATVTNADNIPAIQAPPVPPTVNVVPPGPDDPQATARDEVYVRSGPGNQYPAYGIAPEGANARVIGVSEDGQWWAVRIDPAVVGTGYGWVPAFIVDAKNTEGVPVIQAPPEATQVTPVEPAPGSPTAMATDYVNVRSGPGLNYPVLGVAAPGAQGEVTGVSEDGQWWQIRVPTTFYPNGQVWVSASYVITTNAESVPVVSAPVPPPVAPTPLPTSACVLITQSPQDGTIFGAGSAFEMLWLLQNVGSTAWDAAEVDLKFVTASSARLSAVDVIDLTTTVDPAQVYEAKVPMQAPADPGQYSETWSLVQGEQVLCQFYVIISAQ